MKPLAIVVFVILCVVHSASARADGMSLAGSEWQPTFFSGAKRPPWIAFKPGGMVIGSDGCNSMRGTYVVDGSSLKLGPLAVTRKMCPPAIMKQAMRFTGALNAARKFKATHLHLTLMDGAGKKVMTLRRRDFD